MAMLASASSPLLSLFLCLLLTFTSQATARSSLLQFSCHSGTVTTSTVNASSSDGSGFAGGAKRLLSMDLPDWESPLIPSNNPSIFEKNSRVARKTNSSTSATTIIHYQKRRLLGMATIPYTDYVPPIPKSPFPESTTGLNTYQDKVKALLTNLSTHTDIDYGFYNFSDRSGEAHAIGLCRGDVKPDDCRRCLNNSVVLLRNNCSNSVKGIVWVDNCMVRYSNTNIFGVLDTNNSVNSCNGIGTSNSNVTQSSSEELNDLLERLKKEAASGDSKRKFASGNSSESKLYAVAQCTPDLSEEECLACFSMAFPRFILDCGSKGRGFAISPSCSIRFDTFRFYGDTPPLLRTPSLAPDGVGVTKKGKISPTVIAIAVAIVVFVLIFVCLAIWLTVRRQRNPRNYVQDELGSDVDIIANDLSTFDFESLRVATENFSVENKLGEGGSGIVFKGKLSDGQEVAIKKLFKKSWQEFKNEVPVAKLQHRNVVRLLGYCVERNERLLVYEYISNKSLEDFISDPIKRANLNWAKRYKIIVGIARGLLYLHEDSGQQTIHRDLKPSNILLDEEINPKISDFGIAKWLEENQTKCITQNKPGTIGYMAPEYERDGEYSAKSDVFSFGILTLEIICGRKNIGIQNGEEVEDLPSLAWRNRKGGTLSEIVDSTLKRSSNAEISTCIHIGLLCVQENVMARPTMKSIVETLDGSTTSLPEPSEPVSEAIWSS